MIDLDTSVVVALLTPEDRNAPALDWIWASSRPLISSDWLITETDSALGIKQRHHGLSSTARQLAGEQFERLLKGGVELRSLDRDCCRKAAELLQDPGLGLRTGDTLHLAVALHSRCSCPRHEASTGGRQHSEARPAEDNRTQRAARLTRAGSCPSARRGEHQRGDSAPGLQPGRSISHRPWLARNRRLARCG